jgi:phage-related protein (TIGR01555 family)
MRKSKRNKKPAASVQEPRTVRGIDAFQNALARLGMNQENIMEGTQYPLTRLTQNYQLMNSLYRSHWIIRRIIDTIPEDMCKNWYNITSQVQPDMLDRYTKMERKTRTKAKIMEGLRWGRLFGGAAAIILISGHEQMLEQPLNYDMIMPGSYKGLLVLDRWSGITPGSDLVTDINDPEYGLPKYYQVTTSEADVFTVHHSRVLRFVGRDLPQIERQAEMYWGASEVEMVFEEIKKRDNTSWNIAQLVFMANLRVMKMEGMEEIFSIGDQRAQNDLYNTVSAQNKLMSNMGVQILGPKDSFETHQYTFSGLNDIYQSFMMDISGSCGIPVTKLFGRSPAGMNATGESDEQNYYETIESQQQADLAPVLDKLVPVMSVSEWGMIPDDLNYKLNPIRKPNNKEMSDLAKSTSETITGYYNVGLFSQKMSLKEIRQQKDITGIGSNITDEDIEAASNDFNTGDIPPVENDLPLLDLDGDLNEDKPLEVEKTA